MCNIIEKKTNINLMVKGIIPEKYKKDTEKKYDIEHNKYLAIKSEIESCKNKDEKDNLEIIFKCSFESYKRLYTVQEFVVFGITLLNMILSYLAIILSKTNNSNPQSMLGMFIFMGVAAIFLLFLVLCSRNHSSRKQSEILYVLEIFNKIKE
jgi:hypothetical protein